MSSETFIDHRPFLSSQFDVNAYANAVLSGRSYLPDEDAADDAKVNKGKMSVGLGEAKGDIGVELAKLNYGIEDVSKQLRLEITHSHPLLLSHLTTSLSLSTHLTPIRQSLTSLSSSLDRLHTKIHTPYEELQRMVQRQAAVRDAGDLVRRGGRFVVLARRLEGQIERMEKAPGGGEAEKDKGKAKEVKGEGERERELAKAALSVAELDALLNPPQSEESPTLPLTSLDFVKAHMPTIDKARDTIIQEMESMVISGLADLNQPLLSSSLQTAHNLRLLPDLVSNLLADLNDAVTLRITKAFDSSAIGREVAAKEPSQSALKFPSRRHPTEPTSSNQAQWIAILWQRLERVIEDVANCCIKVYTLEKVLRLKRDSVTGVEFLEEVMKTLDEKPSFTFWTTLAKAFESQTREIARSSAWLQQALSSGYPRLLRLFHTFFSRISVHTDTSYTQSHQSPEAVLVLRSVSVFETLYLTRSTGRMTEASNGATISYLSGRGNPPGPGEGVQVARSVGNELDSARFDPLLVRTVARNAGKVLDSFTAKVDGMIVKDFTATSLVGPQATQAQQINSQLAGALYHCWLNLLYVEQDLGGKVWEILQPSMANLERTYTRITDPLDGAIKRELSTILARIHRTDFSKPVDPMSMMGGGADGGVGGGGGSRYMQDLIEKLGLLRAEILGRINLGEFMREWVLAISKYILHLFLLHASIARPMGESGKLKLTGDMTELEVGIQGLLSVGQVQGQRGGVKIERVGEEYLALRSFRTLLFSPPSSLANPVETVHLPPLIVLHHLIVLSPLLLPHEVHNWSEVEYVLWLQKHQELDEQLDLLERAVDDHLGPMGGKESGGKEGGEEEWVRLIREVITHARQQEEEGLSPMPV